MWQADHTPFRSWPRFYEQAHGASGNGLALGVDLFSGEGSTRTWEDRLAETQVMLNLRRIKRLRVLLFFDTFEQPAVDAVPWLLDYFLEAEIKNTVVLVIAGRDPLEQSTPDSSKRWLPYHDNHTIYSISLDGFTPEWLELMIALAYQLLLLPDEDSHIQAHPR